MAAMADISCRVCGEPWDAHHIRHDAPAWVAPLFFAGAGCESCEGEKPEGVDKLTEQLSDTTLVLDSAVHDGDPLELRPAIMGVKTPKWERPKNETVWQCAGDTCQVRVERNWDWAEGHGAAYEVIVGGYHLRKLLGLDDGDEFPNKEDAINTISLNGTHCRDCAYTCHKCSKLIIEGESFSAPDPRDPYHPTKSVCEDCFSELEYEVAVESFNARDLFYAIGYSRHERVSKWVDNVGVTFNEAYEAGLCEIEGDSVKPTLRYSTMDDTKRSNLAVALRKLHTLILSRSEPSSN